MEYAGANNPIYLIRNVDSGKVNESLKPFLTDKNENFELFEIKSDKQPIGYFDVRKNYQNNVIDIQKGDTIYLFSDGFADQFGGSKGKKYKYAQFKKLLLDIQNQSFEEQRGALKESFDTWKMQFEQVDDVCIIGLRI